MIVSACLQLMGTHPELIQRQDALLCSINDRLGSLSGVSGGQSVSGLGSNWLAEVLGVLAQRGEE